MSDLISRKQTLEFLENTLDETDDVKMLCCIQALCATIDLLPTAYDVDKVVKELEERMEKAKSISEKSEELGYERHMFYQAGKENAFNEAIWIVKGGGVNE